MPKLKIWVITNDPYDPKFLSPLQSKALFTFAFITIASTFSPDGPLSSTHDPYFLFWLIDSLTHWLIRPRSDLYLPLKLCNTCLMSPWYAMIVTCKWSQVVSFYSYQTFRPSDKNMGAPQCGQICNYCKWHCMVTKIPNDASDTALWLILQLTQMMKLLCNWYYCVFGIP